MRRYVTIRHVARHTIIMPTTLLSEPVLLILLSLASRPQHGYAILKDVEGLSDSRIKLSTGTLYGALSRLLDGRWIERVQEESAPRGRQTYQLTPAGRSMLRAEVARLQSLAHIAALRLKPRES
jgi:DNA-binding PadR family transcriptional regulator